MKEILSSLLTIAVLVFAASSMLSVGFGHTLRQIVGLLRNARGVVRDRPKFAAASYCSRGNLRS
jgi:hypothetical protein